MMNSSTATALFSPTFRRNNNIILSNINAIYHSVLHPWQRCDHSQWARRTLMSSSSSGRIIPFVRTKVQQQQHHGIRSSSNHIQANRLIYVNERVWIPLFPLYEPVPVRYPKNIRRYHTTRYVSSDTAVAAATTDNAASSSESTAVVGNNNEMPPILWTTHRLKPEQIQKVDAIFHKILWLDLFEASMLNEIVNARMGVTLNNKQKRQLNQLMEQRALEASGDTSSATGNDGGAKEEVETGPVLVDIKLSSFDAASKIKVIKEVRSILNLGLKEAKEMVESAPVTLQKGVKQELADELKTKLEAVGAKIDIV
jgi:large subunit ribosomal protein L7/L12